MKDIFRKRIIRSCIISALFAVLSGCSESNDTTSETASTFPAIVAEKIVASPALVDSSDEVVVGIVTAVPGTSSAVPPEASVVVQDPLVIFDGGKVTTTEQEIAPLAVKEREEVTRFVTTSPDTIENPTFWSSPAYEYDLGNLVASVSTDSSSFTYGQILITPIKGWIRYPMKSVSPTPPGQYPVIVFLHGQHTPADPNYRGYDYLAENLATHGYIVLSIDANAINADGDQSGQSRAQLVLGTLDRLRQINEHGQVDKNGNAGALNKLKGKFDFERIGIMGHSRGGQGVANTIKFNQNRRGASYAGLAVALSVNPTKYITAYPDFADVFIPKTAKTVVSLDEEKFRAAIAKYNIFYAEGSDTASPYDFRAAFLLAPTDFGGNKDLNGVPLAVLLPTCDGDMLNLQGAISYDHNRFGNGSDTATRYQIAVQGANHNYYNTTWINDDFSITAGPGHCMANHTDTIRVSDEDQRRNGLYLINSFMRYHVGGEQQFASWWNGMAQLPEAACPVGRGPCDERVILTIQRNEGQRKLIQHFASAESLSINSLGGPVTSTGFNNLARCDMPDGARIAGNCSPARIAGFEFNSWGGSGLRSIAEHAELSWTKAGATITNDLLGTSAAPHDTLSFRIAVVRPMGQEVLVTLIDNVGKEATIEASDFSGALYNAPKTKAEGRPMIDDPIDKPYSTGQVKMLLNMVAIPLKAFAGIDLNNLKELKLTFPKDRGKVALADIQFQTLGRDQFGPRMVAVQNKNSKAQ